MIFIIFYIFYIINNILEIKTLKSDFYNPRIIKYRFIMLIIESSIFILLIPFSFIIWYLGIMDTLFELSFFGAAFAKDEFQTAWKLLSGGNCCWYVDYNIQINGADANVTVFDDCLCWGSWIGQLGVTIVFIWSFLAPTLVLLSIIFRWIKLIKEYKNGKREKINEN